MTDITPLSADALATLVEDFEASDHNRMAMNAVTAAGEGDSGAAGVMDKARARLILAGPPSGMPANYRLTRLSRAAPQAMARAVGKSVVHSRQEIVI